LKASRRQVLPSSDLATGSRARSNVADEVEKLHRLHLVGALTEAEFGYAKAALLRRL
jgi:hypothetical protein